MKWFSLPCLALAVVVAAALPLGGADKDDKMPAGLAIDKEKRTVTLDCKVARKIDDPAFKKIYDIEVIACWPFRKEPPGGHKAHETMLSFDFAVKPSQVHKALEDLGLKAGMPVMGEGEPTGPEVKILVEFTDADGQLKKLPPERLMVAKDSDKKLPAFRWRFTGSAIKQPNPEKPDLKVYGADLSGTLMSIFPVTADTVFQTQLTIKEEKFLKLETNDKVLPKAGSAVKLIIEAPAAKKD